MPMLSLCLLTVQMKQRYEVGRWLIALSPKFGLINVDTWLIDFEHLRDARPLSFTDRFISSA